MSNHNNLVRFVLNDAGIRGAVVSLSDVLTQMTGGAGYEPVSEQLLHESAVAVSLLASILKIDGAIGLEIRRVNQVKYLVTQMTNQRHLRGMLQPFGAMDSTEGPGQVIISIEPEKGKRYQGVVQFNPAGVAQTLESYFQQSEQMDTFISIGGVGSQLIGVLAQPLGGAKVAKDWKAQLKLEGLINAIAESDKQAEDVIALYFRQNEYLVYPAEPVVFQCKCSREKSQASLNTLGEDEIRQYLAEDGQIITTCGFCGVTYQFNEADFDFI